MFAFEVISGGTFPRVQLRMVGEPGDVKLFRKTVRLPRDEFQNHSDPNEKNRVCRNHQNIGMQAMNHDCLAPTSTTSVKRRSAGSSCVTSRAECRIPSQAR